MDPRQMAEWLTEVIKGIVLYPDEVSVEAKEPDEMGVLFTAKVNTRDAGRVIGKGGQNAAKIRALLDIAGFHHGIRASLKIDVPEIAKKVVN